MFGFRRKPAPQAVAADAATWRARGNEALGQGRVEEAADCYRRAIAADEADPLARVNLGYVLLEQGRADDAAQALAQAIARAPQQPEVRADAQYLLARAHQAQGRTQDAEAALRAALAARPAFVEAAQDLVPLLLATGRAGEALQVARQAAAAAPVTTLRMLQAQALHALHRSDEALAQLDAVLAEDPSHLGALESRGNLLLEAGRAQEALAAFERGLAAHGRSPEALANAAAALLQLQRPADALALAREALRADPAHAASLYNEGRALLDLLRVEEARERTLAALRLHPGNADLEWNSAVAHLLLGDLPAGWRAHEARWGAKGFQRAAAAPVPSLRRWAGEDLAGRSILLYAEQGLGDTLQFLRYVPLVAQRAREVLLQVPEALAPLVQGLAPNVRLVAPGAAVPPVDWQCPLLSLPHAFGTTLQSIPAQVPYLRADAALVRAWRERLPDDGRPRVGITWSGNPRHGNDRNRSLPLAQFRRIAVEGFRFVALQPQVREADRAELAAWEGLVDAGPSLRSFADTAALMEALDLVIAVDTSVAHLAGALGRPTWVLLPHAPDWRWLLQRDDSPWYPTARLYRQPAAGDWGPVLDRLRADLLARA